MENAVGPPITKRSLQNVVYGRLHAAILNGRIKPGTKLNISELAEELNVSAVPVREALRQLEAEGCVSFQPNKKVVINQLSEEELNDIYMVMLPMEELALERCFDKIEDSGYLALQGIIDEMTRIGVSKEWINLNWRFHTQIHEIAGSPRLLNILKVLRSNIIPYLHLSILDEARTNQANQEHLEIFEALKSQKKEKAKAILHRHLENGQKTISRILSQIQ